ncbi:MAG TPA: SusC/RagA family TonB-linked outer membrane protein [Puia sp.]|uniref:SusC/RagA family TonB-linked outer membrane protein n=1 Tax=Puia sp. TaxID=2045100 RepID=UPI002BE37611|nr:SusC/RagA family TonB-linked outer membrane protein [Puia sp.]HVU97054.1 SusC/RagA family TonB-linked outer membrane protein [Puia sp.]
MRVVRLIAIIVLSTCLQASAGVFSQNITFSGKNVPLEKVFTVINKQSGYLVFCDYSLLREAKNVDIHVKDAPVETVLKECLKGQALAYEIVDKTIVIERKKPIVAEEPAAVPPPIDIHGRVTNEKGESVPGATVQVKGTSKVVTANDNGEFTLNGVDDHAVLVITSVGYEKIEVNVGGQTSLTVTMKVGAAAINEIVVTALGISKEERKLGYAVTTVGGEQLNKARETNVALSLGGQVAGLTVHGANGGPGSSARILLRGMPSMNSGGSPLFVINGVPMDNSQRGAAGEWGGSDNGDGIGNINPDDIETMTVLKGQAASALYGARASNGVIIITTKTAKKGQSLIEYNGNAQFDRAANYTDYQYQYGQGDGGVKPSSASGALATNRFAWGGKLDGSQAIQYNGKSYAYSPFKDNIKNFYRTGPTWTNTVSVGSGTDRGNWRLSASTLDNTSIIRNSGIQRRTLNLNLSQKVTDKLTATLFANYIDEQDHNRPQLSDGPGDPNNFQFLAPNVDERIFKPGQDANGREIVFSDDNYVTNPWFVVNNWINNTGRKRLIGNTSLKYNFYDWLYVMGRVGIDKEDDRIFQVTPTGTDYSYNNKGQSGQLNGLTTLTTTELNWDGLIGVSHKLTDDVHLDATLGGNVRTNDYEYLQLNGSQFVVPYLYTPSNVATFGRQYYYYSKEIHSGYYSVDLNYKDWLLLNTTGRYDAFSTLPKGDRGIFTPSVSGGFVFSHFLENTAINFGKLRAAYAQTSGEPIGGPNNTNSGAYQTNIYYGVGNPFNGTAMGTLNGVGSVHDDLPSLPNLFLKPFTLTEVELGAEVKLFNSRLGIDADYFTRKTKHEIQQGTLSLATGYNTYYVGTGSTQNNGVEVQITGSPVKTRAFTWNISFNYTHVTNKILETDAAGNPVTLGTYRPLNANTAFVKGLAGPQIMAYDYTYDAKGNVVVDGSGLPVRAGKETPFGNVLPTDFGGLRNDFTFGNINFGFLIDYNYGNKILSATSYYTIYRGLNKLTLNGREAGITTGVTSTGAQNTKTATAEQYYQDIAQISRNNVLNGNYIKFRQVTLGYTFSNKMLGNNPIFEAINVSLVGRNLFYFMKKSPNIDPESNFTTTVKYAGIEGTSLPSARTFGVNVNVKFKK